MHLLLPLLIRLICQFSPFTPLLYFCYIVSFFTSFSLIVSLSLRCSFILSPPFFVPLSTRSTRFFRFIALFYQFLRVLLLFLFSNRSIFFHQLHFVISSFYIFPLCLGVRKSVFFLIYLGIISSACDSFSMFPYLQILPSSLFRFIIFRGCSLFYKSCQFFCLFSCIMCSWKFVFVLMFHSSYNSLRVCPISLPPPLCSFHWVSFLSLHFLSVL